MQRRLFLRASAIGFAISVMPISSHAEQITSLEKAAEKAKELTEYLSLEKLVEVFTFNFKDCIKSLSFTMGICISLILINSVFNVFRDSFKGYEKIFEIISSALYTLCILSAMSGCIDTVESTLTAVCSYMTAFVPIGASLLAASGNTVTASSSAVLNTFFISTTELISVTLILPCIKAICVINCVNTLCKNTNLSGISAFIKSTCLWLLGLSFTALTGIMSLQSILASGADSLAMKGIKFSAARLIPIAGGMLSESMKTVISTMSYIKSVTGTGAVVFIIYTLALPLCAIIASKLYFAFLSCLAKVTCQTSEASLFDGMSSCINLLAALLLGCCVAFIIMLGIFIKITVTV